MKILEEVHEQRRKFIIREVTEVAKICAEMVGVVESMKCTTFVTTASPTDTGICTREL